MNFIKLLSETVIKHCVVTGYNKINKTSLLVNPAILSVVESTIDDRNMIIDPVTKAGLLFERIDISTLIPKGMDISSFKDDKAFNHQLQELTPEQIVSYNEKIQEQLISNYENNFSNLNEYDMDTLKKYAVFCRLMGFFDLDITDVKLHVSEGTLAIEVKEGNKMFTGMVEVKTW